MKFTISIEMDNDAFADGNAGLEVVNTLNQAVSHIRKCDYELEDFTLFDTNGNKVGRAFISVVKG